MAATRDSIDRPALEQVLGREAPRVYSLAWRLLGNDADAEDATQEVMLQVLRKLDSFRGEASFTTWLHRVTVNVALSYRRQRAAREKHHSRQPMDDLGGESPLPEQTVSGPVRHWAAPPDQQALDHETRERIEAAIAGLPEKYRDVYVLADVEGLPNAEIGALLGLELAAVKTRLHRARLMVRHTLAPYFEDRTS